ncbi:MAG: DUF167 domain-containing protein [Planctomycetales bacterium]
MPLLEPHPAGSILRVHAQPGARKNAILGVHADRLKVAVTQAPEKGKANHALCEVLAKELDLKKSQVSLLSGETSGQKKFLISGVTPDELTARLAPWLAHPSGA